MVPGALTRQGFVFLSESQVLNESTAGTAKLSVWSARTYRNNAGISPS